MAILKEGGFMHLIATGRKVETRIPEAVAQLKGMETEGPQGYRFEAYKRQQAEAMPDRACHLHGT